MRGSIATMVVCGFVVVGGLLGGCGASESDSSSSAFTRSSLAAADAGACSPHYIVGATAKQIAASLSSVYGCVVSRSHPRSLAALNRFVMQYVLGRDELATRGFTNADTSIIGLWREMGEGGFLASSPGVSKRLTFACQDFGLQQGGGINPSIEVSQTLTIDGHARTGYARYVLVPTTPRIAGFDAADPGRQDRHIWTLLYEREIGDTPRANPTRGSCNWPLRRAGYPDSLDLTIG